VLADGPRAYWRLGESSGTTAADQLGLAPGSYQKGVLLGVPGALVGDASTAVRLDGRNDRISMGDAAGGALDFGTGDFTAEAWVKPSVNDERLVVAKKDYGSPTPPHWQVTVTDDPNHAGQIRANIFDGTFNRQAYGPSLRVDDGLWHHVVVVFDRDTGITVYVDGTARLTPGAMTGSVSNSGEFTLGKAPGNPEYRGDLDEVAVYPGALSSERVLAHYSIGIGQNRLSGGSLTGSQTQLAFSSLLRLKLAPSKTAASAYRLRSGRTKARK
jgi:Concanavalin A-like lectin/glucanases superfamily